MNDKLSLNRALLWILVSILCISGSAFMGWLYILKVKEKRRNDDQYRLVAILSHTTHPDPLKTVHFAEFLDLSLDRPVNLYPFDVAEARKTLLRIPMIKDVTIKKILPGTLYIHYEKRLPIAYIGDYANTAVDEEGKLFPFRPFFTPKRLPTLYLGLEKEKCDWAKCIKDETVWQLALKVIEEFNRLKQEEWDLKDIDVTQAEAPSYGQRQIVVTLATKGEEINKRTKVKKAGVFLRLNEQTYAQGLMNFLTYYQAELEKKESIFVKNVPIVIDLRIPHLAFIKSGS